MTSHSSSGELGILSYVVNKDRLPGLDDHLSDRAFFEGADLFVYPLDVYSVGGREIGEPARFLMIEVYAEPVVMEELAEFYGKRLEQPFAGMLTDNGVVDL